MKKRFWPSFLLFIECAKPQETLYEGPKAIFTVTVERIREYFWDLRGC